jgi:RimJ/RimL family protein N-acetyltransferase
MTPDDLPVVLSWREDPSLYGAYRELDPIAPPQQAAWYQRMLARDDERNFVIVRWRQPEVSLGTISLLAYHPRNRRAELGRFVLGAPSHRGWGMGVEAQLLMMRYAFAHMNLYKLSLLVLATNRDAVCPMHAALGFRHDGAYHQHVYKQGRYEDVLVMSMLRHEYHQQAAEGRLGRLMSRFLPLPASLPPTSRHVT